MTPGDPVSFSGRRWWPAAVFAVVLALVSVLSAFRAIVVGDLVIGEWGDLALVGSALLVVAIVAIRVDGPPARTLVPTADRAVAGLVAVLVLWVGGSVLLAAVAAGAGWSVRLGIPISHPGRFWPPLVAWIVVTAIPEELLFRGYLQNRLTSDIGGGGGRWRRGVAIALAVAAFVVYHVPSLVEARGLEGLTAVYPHGWWYLVVLGAAWAIAYELTRSLTFVVVAHALFNVRSTGGTGFLIDVGLGSTAAGTTVILVHAIAAIGAAVVLRRWMQQRSIRVSRHPPDAEGEESHSSTGLRQQQ